MANSQNNNHDTTVTTKVGFCERISAELRHLPLAVEEPLTGTVLHGPDTFGPHGRWILVTKTLLILWTLTVMLDGILLTPSNNGDSVPHVFYWAYLTHWTLTMSLLYLITSWYHSLQSTILLRRRNSSQGDLPNNNNNTSTVTIFHKVTWVLFAIAAPGEIVVAFGYWGLEWDGTAETALVYRNLMIHGVIVAIVLMDGFVLNRIPLRLSHGLFLLAYLATYLVWTVVYEILNIDNPWTTDDDENIYDDHLYKALQWQDDLTGTTIAAAQLLFVAVPVAFVVAWGLSLYSFPCGGCQGAHRRTVANAGSSTINTADNRTSYVEMKTLEQTNSNVCIV